MRTLFLATVLGIAILFLLWLLSPYHPSVKEPLASNAGANMSLSTNYFSPDYSTARARFLRMAEAARGRLESLVLDAGGPTGEALTIDIAWFGSLQPHRVLLHSSGLHGVEAFAGSAIQLKFLDSLPEIPDDAAIVLIHTLNPYGMAWLRRVNEANVDLNRNFLGPGEDYSRAPDLYGKLDSFLNSTSLPSWDYFHLKTAWFRVRYGGDRLREAIAGGQYEYPRGLFFGGTKLQQGPEKYQNFIAQRLASVERIVAIDVHTGLGKYSEDTLLVDEKYYQAHRAIFGPRVEPLDRDLSSAYRVRGGIHSMFYRLFSEVELFFLSQEFGTYNPVSVLYALREENRWHHYGDGSVDHPTKHRLKDAFAPNDDSWRQRVLVRGRELLKQAVEVAFTASNQP